MVGKLMRRAVEAAVALLALYAFAFVPLGSKTGLGHARAILDTTAAKDASREAWNAATRLFAELTRSRSPAPPQAVIVPTSEASEGPDASVQ